MTSETETYFSNAVKKRRRHIFYGFSIHASIKSLNAKRSFKTVIVRSKGNGKQLCQLSVRLNVCTYVLLSIYLGPTRFFTQAEGLINNQFSNDHWSQTTLSLLSTSMGVARPNINWVLLSTWIWKHGRTGPALPRNSEGTRRKKPTLHTFFLFEDFSSKDLMQDRYVDNITPSENPELLSFNFWLNFYISNCCYRVTHWKHYTFLLKTKSAVTFF